MKEEEINKRIAEACGWKQSERNIAHWHHVSEPYSHMLFRDLPNYCADLNAMHKAENVLILGFEDDPENSELWSDYQTNLIIACPPYLSYHATARQRAEAFLRTLGKWEEATDKDSLTVQTASPEQSSVDYIGEVTEMVKEAQK